ncbi:MAG: hypothetical protein HDR25_04095 [Lachnospiraceae bacterium]|nr:hypothetical protein [Lachnospiraceae bacterium]
MDVKEAVDAAVNSCIADGIMKAFLRKHKAEVLSVCITEFDEKVFVKGIREEGREEGIEIGEARGRSETKKKTALSLLKRGKLTIEEIAEDTGLSVAEVEQLAELQTV